MMFESNSVYQLFRFIEFFIFTEQCAYIKCKIERYVEDKTCESYYHVGT